MKKFICVLMICLITVTALGLSVYAAVPYDNLIGFYNMEGELKDLVSEKYGTLWNGASFVDDASRGGKVLYLNNADVELPGYLEEGGKGYYVEGQWAELALPHIPNADTMTVSLWFKCTENREWARVIDFSDAKSQKLYAIDKEAAEGVGPDRYLQISPLAPTGGGEFLLCSFNCNDMGDRGVPSNRDRIFAELMPENTWIHVCLVIDINGKTPNVLYVNGVPYESNHSGPADDPAPAEFSPKDLLSSPEGLKNAFVGRSPYENEDDYIMWGYVDDIAIFDVALTAAQVAELRATDLSMGIPGRIAIVEEETAEEAAPPSTTVPPTVTSPVTSDAGLIILAGIMMIAGFVVFRKKNTI